MLRTINSEVLGGRLLGFQATTAASAVNTVQVGSMEGAFTNATADHQLDIALRKAFARTPILVGTPGSNVAAGGAVSVNSDPTVSALSLLSVNGSNSADVGSLNALCLGFDHRELNVAGGQRFPVYSSFRSPRIVSGQIASGTTVAIGTNQVSVASGGTGVYNVTFLKPFARIPVVVASVKTGAQGSSVNISSITRTGFVASAFDAANTATAIAFNFIAYGSDSPDEISMDRGRAIQTQMRKPRMLGFHISYSGGTPSLSVGGAYGSVVDTATGRVTLNYTKAFAREPLVVVSAEDATSRWASIDTSSASSCLIEVAGSTGTLGDPTDVFVLVLGSDDATEY